MKPSKVLAFWLVAFAFAAVMCGTAMPSPLYPGYEEHFGFGPLTVTAIYAVYAVGVLGALVFLGRASDAIGRKRVLLPGLAVAALASTVFVAAGTTQHGGLQLLLVARVLSGVSAGIFTGTATATLADLAGPTDGPRAARTAALANLFGTGTGPLFGGFLAQWVVMPLRTTFLLHLGLLAMAAAALVAIPETVRATHPLPRQRLGLTMPPETRAVFAPAAAAGFAGFAVSGLFVAVTPALLAALGHHDPALTGAVVASLFAAAIIGTLLSAMCTNWSALLFGTRMLMVALAFLAVALSLRSIPLLLAAAATAGISQGLGFRAAVELVVSTSDAQHRGAVSSMFFAVCYVGGTSLPVLGVGVAAHYGGLVLAGEVFAGVVAITAAAALFTLARRRDAEAPPVLRARSHATSNPGGSQKCQ